MRDLQARIEDLRRRIQNRRGPEELAELERAARDLLRDAKNTPQEEAAQAIFADLARLSSPGPGTEGAPALRGLLRRARIRIEMAGDADDVDEAIDILAEALSMNRDDPELIAMMQQAAAYNQQTAHRVADLFNRYGVKEPALPPQQPPKPTQAPPEPDIPDAVDVYTAARGAQNRPAEPPSRNPAPQSYSGGNGGDSIDELLRHLTDTYYAGDYQATIDTANRILSVENNNSVAREFRQKAEDNLIRGIVPDHRIPFDARVSFNRANSLVRAGNYDEAAKLYREARELAERDGILSWKDVEQALLDIQDLALARELLNEGDRLLAADNWAEALRKYEGALRVVPNDPQGEERVDNARRIQQEANQVSVQLNMLGGSLEEQVQQLLNIRAALARVRQLLPTSQRLIQLQNDTDSRLNAVKTQLADQAAAAMNRAQGATAVDDKLALTNEALKLLDSAVQLDPSDTSLSERLMEARAESGDLTRARQTIERASSLVMQNFDSELTQARGMLANLSEYAQDERYRYVVNELLTRYLERADYALEEGNMAEAEQWLAATREEPFRILGRRTEVYRTESAIRRRRGRTRTLVGGIIFIIIMGLIALAFATRPSWEAAFFPSPTPTETTTPTPTETLTPSITPTASDTPTPSPSWTPSLTPTSSPSPTWTWTPSPTWTPSWTPTASLTPTHTNTPTPTSTHTSTPTVTPTPTITNTPTITATPPDLCRVIVLAPQGIRMRTEPNTISGVIRVLGRDSILEVIQQERQPNGTLWYQVRVNTAEGLQQGWVRSDTVQELEPSRPCPGLPDDDA